MACTTSSWRMRVPALIAAAALGGALAVGGVAPAAAYAADGTVTIQTKDQSKVTYVAYQLFTADVTEAGGKVTAKRVAWGTGLSDYQITGIAAFLETKGYAPGSNDPKNAQDALVFISEQIRTSEGTGDPKIVASDSFAMELAKELIKLGVTGDEVQSGAAYTKAEGYYLFLNKAEADKKHVATSPIWFPLGCDTTTIVEKSSMPTVDKTIDGKAGSTTAADYEIGDLVPFKVVASLPSNIISFDAYRAVIVDTPTKGLDIDMDSVTVKIGGKAAQQGGYTAVKGAASDATSGALTVTIANVHAAADPAVTVAADTTIEITYNARLTKAAVAGANLNNVSYEFSNDPANTGEGGSTTTTEDPKSNKAYTFAVDVLKKDKATGTALDGAKFKIHNADGEYYNSANADPWSSTDANQAEVLTVVNGKLNVVGLSSGEYTLIETEAPEGYEIVGDGRLVFTINATYDGGTLATLDVTTGAGDLADEAYGPTSDPANFKVTVTAVNDKSISLAMTGAEGVGLAGAAVLAVGLGWYLVRRRNGADQA